MKDNQRPPEDSPSAQEDTASKEAEFDDAASGSFRPAAGTAVSPPPVNLPGPDATTAGFTGAPQAASATTGAAPGAPAGEPPHVPNPLDSTQLAESPGSATRIADDPLAGKQPADDPPGSDPLTLDRRNAARPHGE